ncbi:MAG: hypothetical protein RPT12_12650 [Vibrio anguillarum]|nr:hypothetical protein [Vibrio anguillarum]
MVLYSHNDTVRNGGTGFSSYRKAKKNAASESGLLLYPLGTFYDRSYLIEHGVFSADELAPDTELPFRMQMDDNDPVRRMIAHAHGLNAQWYACGEIGSEELLQPYPERHLRSEFGKGVTSELLAQILRLKATNMPNLTDNILRDK